MNYAQPLPYYAMPAMLVKPSIMLSIMLASWTGLCIYIYTYTCAVCVSDNDSAIIEPTQLTELKCEHLQCPILEKLSPQI